MKPLEFISLLLTPFTMIVAFLAERWNNLLVLLERHEKLAGWAQAVGAVLAIFVSVGIVQWQNTLEIRRAHAVVEREKLRQLSLLVAIVQEANLVTHHTRPEWGLLSYGSPQDARFIQQLQFTLDSIDDYPRLQLPSAELWKPLVFIRKRLLDAKAIFENPELHNERGRTQLRQVAFEVNIRSDRIMTIAKQLGAEIPREEWKEALISTQK